MPEERLTDLPLRGVSVLVTGATGKLGGYLVTALLERGAQVAVLTRAPARARALWPHDNVAIRVADLCVAESLATALADIEVVFHLASYSPQPEEPDIYEAPAHWTVSALGTRNLVQAACALGVRRLIYLSSVKAMGDAAGAAGRPANEATPSVPDTLYGRAKRAAEQAVLGVAPNASAPMLACVLRLPMVYGLDAQGNIARMVGAIACGRFPPWPKLNNRRSAVHVADVVGAALLVACDRRASGQTYLLTDGETYSTRWLYEQSCLALGRPVPRWSVPLSVLRAAASLGSIAERLTGRAMPLTQTGLSKLVGDAWYSSAKIRNELEFVSHYHLEWEVQRLAERYRYGDSR
jgi:UDP-glucose 4-epimerase